MIKRNNLVYNISSINEYGVDKNIKQPIRVAVKDVRLITDYKLNIIYDNGATKNIELINNSIKKFEYVSEGNKIIIETNNNDKFEIEIPIDGGKWELVEGLLRTKDGAKITLHDISEIDSDLGAEDEFLNKKGEFVTPSHSALENKNSEASFQHVTQEEKDLINVHTEDISDLQTNKAGKSTTLSGYGITDAYTKTEINSKISAVFRYKGSIPTYIDLTALTGMTVGDVYNITETGDNYAWTGTEWDKLSGEIDLSAYLTIVDASNTYETKVNVNSLGNIVSGHTEDISELQTNKADKATTLSGYGITDAYTKDEIDTSFENHKKYSNVTREDLLALINNNELVPNSSYRITNYTTTTVQADTTSAGHDFDIIVTALSTNELSEIASCVRKSGDTYFANANLEAWEIKYCIDNDTSRFAWADTVNGKGVIYYMKDEWNNECPYEFKNIQFKRYPILSMSNGSTALVFDANTQKTKYALKDSDGDIVPIGAVIDENNASYYFTFNAILQDSVTYDIYDASVTQKGIKNSEGGDFIVQNNKVNEAHTSFDYPSKYGQILKLNNIVINNIVNSLVYTSLSEGCHSNTFDNECYYITFGNNCYSNTFSIKCDSNTFGNGCYYNRFGNGFDSNTFGNNCFSNTFGDKCDTNTFGDSSYYNTFGNGCDSNTFGSSCISNTLGNNCNYNTLDNNCNYNTFGDNSNSNTFGSYCNSNMFGSYCNSNMFGIKCDYNKFGNYCYNNNFYTGTTGTTKKNYIRYIVLEDGCRYNNFYSSITTDSSSYLQRIRIKGLEFTTATNTQITLSATNTKYEWLICYKSDGTLKQYCPNDLTNNYTYKIEDTSVSTWSASTAYAGYGYQAQINITDLNEADSVNVVFGVNEAISGNYTPAIEIYSGYILVFAKVDTTIIIPTIEITKI